MREAQVIKNGLRGVADKIYQVQNRAHPDNNWEIYYRKVDAKSAYNTLMSLAKSGHKIKDPENFLTKRKFYVIKIPKAEHLRRNESVRYAQFHKTKDKVLWKSVNDEYGDSEQTLINYPDAVEFIKITQKLWNITNKYKALFYKEDEMVYEIKEIEWE